MSPTFVLGSSSALPPAPTLNLLPFSLGSISRPYTSSTAPIGSFFQPRPAPAGTPGIEPGTPIAAFRGRQLAGQSVPVPRGYRGVIIAADRSDVVKYSSLDNARQDDEAQGGETGISNVRRSRTRRDQWPLTPAASTSSTFGHSSSTATLVDGTTDGEDDEGTELHRSPKRSGFAKLKQRVKGAGQVALARPKRSAVNAGKKRYRLDSDDDEEADGADGSEHQARGNVVGVEVQVTQTITTNGHCEPLTEPNADISPTSFTPSTPSKRSRSSMLSTPTRQSPRLAKSDPRTPASTRRPALPYITLQEATPLKSPLPVPPMHLRRKRNKADYVIPGSPGANVGAGTGAGNEDEPDNGDEQLVMSSAVRAPSPAAGDPAYSYNPPSPSRSSSSSSTGGTPMQRGESTVIPSPATENDPPAFPVLSRTSSEITQPKVEPRDPPPHILPDQYGHEADLPDITGPIRVLLPVATFDRIILWTADGPLAGYKDPERDTVPGPHGHSESGVGTLQPEQNTNADAQPPADSAAEADGVKVRQGWWLQGGSGEGGDEVVRAMGEWLGLVEMLNEPVYLDKFKDEDEDEDDED